MKLRSVLPSLRDLHIYGGGVVVSLGVGLAFGFAYGLVVAGLFLIWIGAPWR